MHAPSSTSTPGDVELLERGAPAPPGPSRRGIHGVTLPLRRAVLAEWLARLPLVPVAAGLATGIAIDAAVRMPTSLIIAGYLPAGAILWRSRGSWAGWAAVLAAACFAGAGLHDAAWRHWPQDHLVRYCDDRPVRARLTGEVLSSPTLRPPPSGSLQPFEQPPSTRLLLEARSIRGTDGDLTVSGRVALLVREPLEGLEPGDRVEVLGRLHRPVPPRNPGGVDWPRARRREGVLVEMDCARAANVRLLDRPASGRRLLDRLRRRARRAMIEDTFDGDVPGAGMLAALVLGQRSAVDAGLNEAFVRTGTVHYLAVSGGNIAMLASVVWLAGVLLGRPRRQCALAALVVINVYGLLTEPCPSVTRAVVMADALCLGLLLERPASAANLLALAAVILLAASPTSLFAPGFQMSFATVAALVFVGPRLSRFLADAFWRAIGRGDPLLRPAVQLRLATTIWSARRWTAADQGVRGAAAVLGAALPAWAAGSLLSACHFAQFAPWGWLNTLIVLPLVWICLVLGMTKTVLTALWDPLGRPAGAVLATVTEVLTGTVRLLATLPGSGMAVPAVPAWLIGAAAGVTGLWLARLALRIPRQACVAAVLGLTAAAGWRLIPGAPSAALEMHVLAVGDGLCTVIRLPDGRTLVYDCGSMPVYDLERWTIGPLLAQQGAGPVEAVILSHANLDHYAALPELVARRGVRTVIASGHFGLGEPPDGLPQRAKAAALRAGARWLETARGQRIAGTGAVSIDVLWPPHPRERLLPEPNETSIVLRVSFGGRRILLCGDIEEQAQRELMAREDLRADVLVAPHHGRPCATTEAFVQAVNPGWMICSSGPSGASRLAEARPQRLPCAVLNTGEDGAVRVRLAAGSVEVEPFRQRPDGKAGGTGDGSGGMIPPQ